jgi:hypothetical protein
MAVSRDRVTVAWVASLGKALAVGGKKEDAEGSSDVLDTEWFDPATEKFTPGPPLHQGRMAHTLTALKNGEFIVAGGWSVALNHTTESVERFVPDAKNPLGGSFLSLPPMKSSRHDHGAALLPDGRLLIVGGKKAEGGKEEWLKGVEVIRPGN